MARIAVIDDKALIRDSVSMILSRVDHQVDTFEDGAAALPLILEGRFDLVLTDLKVPKMDGLTLIREVRAAGCDTPLIMMTAFGTVKTAVEAMKLGAFDYIQKPLEAEVIEAQVERALVHRNLCMENEALRASLEGAAPRREMIGDSPAFRELRAKVGRIAQSDAAVLITGESGTGKELVAHAIHRQSRRGERPMLCLNCAALSGNLLESELFGHERGAFTGADRLRKGRFELADGGTLLLDEISEMALPLQAKLLRVLQEGEFERVGSSVTRRANVRVIATSNRDLEAWVAKQRFRADLYYRLNVLPIRLPPLRQRPEDVPGLFRHFMAEIARRENRPAMSISQAALEMLMQYRWPGNVRELQNLCERCAALVGEGDVSVSVIEAWMRGTGASAGPGSAAPSALRHGRMLEDAERQLIEQMLQQYNGHREKTARALGMGVRTLGMKLKQWRDEAAAQSGLAATKLPVTYVRSPVHAGA